MFHNSTSFIRIQALLVFDPNEKYYDSDLILKIMNITSRENAKQSAESETPLARSDNNKYINIDRTQIP